MLSKDAHQRYERQLAHNIKFVVTLFYVMFRCVTKFKTTVNLHYFFISYRSLSICHKYNTTSNVHSVNIIFAGSSCALYINIHEKLFPQIHFVLSNRPSLHFWREFCQELLEFCSAHCLRLSKNRNYNWYEVNQERFCFNLSYLWYKLKSQWLCNNRLRMFTMLDLQS